MFSDLGKALAQTHYLERELNPQFGVRALLAIKPNRKAIVFVHGYSGNAISTWAHFNKILLSEPDFAGYDLLFYGYDGLYGELVATVLIFKNFLNWLFGNPLFLINHALEREGPRDKDFAYDRVLIVAHSLGAVVSRWAIIKAAAAGTPWSCKTSLLLFAPAHMGADIVRLIVETSSAYSLLRLGVGVAQIKSPLLEQLKVESKELTDLATEFQSAYSVGGRKYLVARKVCIAQFENVVKNKTFGEDPEPDPIQNSNHKSICKPRPGFHDPMLALRECRP